jgi:hypothetical protein
VTKIQQQENKMITSRLPFQQVVDPYLILNSELSPFARLLFPMIDSLAYPKGCVASNEYFAGIFNMPVSAVKNAIEELLEHEYITIESVKSRRRIFTAPSEKQQARVFDRVNKYINEYHKDMGCPT